MARRKGVWLIFVHRSGEPELMHVVRAKGAVDPVMCFLERHFACAAFSVFVPFDDSDGAREALQAVVDVRPDQEVGARC